MNKSKHNTDIISKKIKEKRKAKKQKEFISESDQKINRTQNKKNRKILFINIKKSRRIKKNMSILFSK